MELSPRQWWNNVNILLNRKHKSETNSSPSAQIHLDDKWINNVEATEKLCSYFVSVTNETTVNIDIPLGNCVKPPTSSEVLYYLSKINEHKSSGISNIPAWLLKNGRN